MIPQHINLDIPALRGTINEPPRVVMAIASEITNPANVAQKVYCLACFIRHQDINMRLATTKSDRAVAFAAKEMDDTLARLGILWDGSFRIGNARQLGLDEPDTTLAT